MCLQAFHGYRAVRLNFSTWHTKTAKTPFFFNLLLTGQSNTLTWKCYPDIFYTYEITDSHDWLTWLQVITSLPENIVSTDPLLNESQQSGVQTQKWCLRSEKSSAGHKWSSSLIPNYFCHLASEWFARTAKTSSTQVHVSLFFSLRN